MNATVIRRLLVVALILATTQGLFAQEPAFINDGKQIYPFGNYNIEEITTKSIETILAFSSNNITMQCLTRTQMLSWDSETSNLMVENTFRPDLLQKKSCIGKSCVVSSENDSILFIKSDNHTISNTVTLRDFTPVELLASGPYLAVLEKSTASPTTYTSQVEIYDLTEFPPVRVERHHFQTAYSTLAFKMPYMILGNTELAIFKLANNKICKINSISIRRGDEDSVEDGESEYRISDLFMKNSQVTFMAHNLSTGHAILQCYDFISGENLFTSDEDSIYQPYKGYRVVGDNIYLLRGSFRSPDCSITIFLVWKKDGYPALWKQWFARAQYCDIGDLSGWCATQDLVFYQDSSNILHILKITNN